MNKDDTTRTKGFINETTGMRHPDEKILIGLILNGDAEVPDTRLRMFGRDGFGTNGDDVRDATFCQRTCRLCRDETGRDGRRPRVSHEDAEGGWVGNMLTDFPKKSLPSMMTLTFLNPILEREREVEESGTVYVVNRLQGNLKTYRNLRHLAGI